MTTTTLTQKLTLTEALATFGRSLEARNRSQGTILAYRTDLDQFTSWLLANFITIKTVDQVGKEDITDYLAELGRNGRSGVTRARKLAAIREFFRYLESIGAVDKSPALSIETPKKEKNARTWLQPDEYGKLLEKAGANSRDYAIIQLFLQTGIRVSELCNLRVTDLDVKAKTLLVTSGKGAVARTVALEQKGIKAIKNWLDARPKVPAEHLFLNRYGDPIGERGVKKLIARYCQAAGITKKAGCHSLRHTFATIKATKGVTAFQLQEWLGHARLDTTQIYVHLGNQNSGKVMESTSL